MTHKVLVAEDEQFTRELLLAALEIRKISTIGVADGSSAIAALTLPDHGFTALITDFSMPGANGIQVMNAAIDVGIRHLGIQSAEIGRSRVLDEGIKSIVQRLEKEFGTEFSFDALAKAYGFSELNNFLDTLGLTN